MSWVKSVLLTFEGIVSAEQFGVNLRKFLQAFPKVLIGRDALLALLLLDWGFEEELQDIAFSQAAHQIVKGAVFLSLDTDAVGFATGRETLDVGSAQEIRGHGELAQECGFTLAQGQSGGAAKIMNLSHVLG